MNLDQAFYLNYPIGDAINEGEFVYFAAPLIFNDSPFSNDEVIFKLKDTIVEKAKKQFRQWVRAYKGEAFIKV